MKTRLLFFLCLTPILGFSQTQIGNDIDGEAAEDYCGSSVALSADGSVVAIVSAGTTPVFPNNVDDPGHVQVYQNDGDLWTQIGDDINAEAAGDLRYGKVALSADGNVVAIGVPKNTGNVQDGGHVMVYQNNAGNWTQVGADIEGENAGDFSGWSVSLSADGSVVAIGAPGNDGNGEESGQVRVYENVGDIWIQAGGDINGEAPGDESGKSVSLSANGRIVAIGAPRNSGNGVFAGQVRVYENIAGMWTQVGSDIDGEAGGDFSGHSVSLSSNGNMVAIGAPFNEGNDSFAGHVRVYENNSNTWTQVGSDIDGQEVMDESGWSVSLSADGNTIAIGAPMHNDNGTVQVYQNIAGNWIQAGSDIDGEADGDFSGWSVSMSGDGAKVAIGAPHNNATGFENGHVRVYDLSTVLSSDHFVQANFKVYPNPAADFVNVQLSEGLKLERVNVYSASGQLVKSERNPVISVNDLAKGTYILEVVTDLGKAGKVVVVE